MRHLSHSSRCATVAISAALALGSTPLLAQEAAPSLDPPAAAEAQPQSSPPASPNAASQPAPSITLPTSFADRYREAAAAESSTEAAPAEAAAAEASAARTSSPDEPRTTSRSAAPAPRPSPAERAPAPAKDASPSVDDDALAAAPAEPADTPAVARENAPGAEARPAAAREPMDVPDGAIAAAVLGVVGLGAAGFLATRRRRREDEVYYDEDVYETEMESIVPDAASEPDLADEPVTSIPEELALTRPVSAAGVVVQQAGSDNADTGKPFAMPEGPVPTGEARQRLIEEMAAAPPDEANPFTSYPSRRKRARILLQARERELRKQATEPFDWRTYQPPAEDDPAKPPSVEADK